MTAFQTSKDTISGSIFISIIIPVYNDQNGLDHVLKGLQSQTMSTTHFEVIIIDNNSKPEMQLSSAISIPCAIYICPTPGSYAARNYGVKKSKGDILVFIDADCYPTPRWLESGTKELLKEDNVIVGGEVLFDKSAKPTAVEQYQYITGFEQQRNITQKGFSATANLFMTTVIFNRVGPFNETLFSGGDREWCWRARDAGYQIRFNARAIVYTKARSSLRMAVVQARRIAGGRNQLYKIESLSTESRHNIAPHRGLLSAAHFIFSQTHMPIFDRIKIFCIAVILKSVQLIEKLRLLCEVGAERR
jgi:glycosyltransferase involved in cell wall biosynthesis